MRKIILLSVSLFFLAGLCGCVSPQVRALRESQTPLQDPPIATNRIEIKNGKFSPETAIASIAEAVIFINNDDKPHQIASDPYPENSILPDLFSNELFKGETYSYTFQTPGTFGYHLEDNPSIRGEIIVQ